MEQRQARPRLIQAMIDAFSLPDLRGKLLFTLFILIIFRFVAQVPVPSVNAEAMSAVMKSNQLFGMLDLFSGGAMRNFSILAMGVYPYITATIVMQLLTPVIPRLAALSREGEAGRNKINMYTHWLAVPLAALQAYGQVVMLSRDPVNVNGVTMYAVQPEGAFEWATIILSMVAGTMFLVWLGELITERGIGNGVSIIIFGGIVAGMPNLVARGELAWSSDKWGIIAFANLALVTILAIVIFTEAARRIPVIGGAQLSDEDRQKMRAAMQKELGGRSMQDLSAEDRQKIFEKLRTQFKLPPRGAGRSGEGGAPGAPEGPPMMGGGSSPFSARSPAWWDASARWRRSKCWQDSASHCWAGC